MGSDQTFHVTLVGEGVKVDKEVPGSVARRMVNLLMAGEAESSVDEAQLESESKVGEEVRAGKMKTSAKEFMAAKKPASDVERVTCLAYYLMHMLETPTFRTRDISKLNGEAHQPRLSNPTVAVNNASRQKYLTPAGGGSKRITTVGEEVVRALPNREAVKKVLSGNRKYRRRRQNPANAGDTPRRAPRSKST